MTRLTRQELYNKVWSIPMIKLSKKLGISDKGLAKVCKRYNIPTPYLGYWAKRQNGYAPKKTPFKGEPDTVVCFSGNGISSNKNITSKKEQRRLKNLHARIEAVKFDALLTEASQTVSKHINKFKASKDFQGKFLVNGNNQISKLNLPRAVTILNNIELMTRTLGGDFIYKEGKLIAKIWNHDFEISINESVIKKEVGKKMDGSGYWQVEIPIYEYNESNYLTVQLGNCNELIRRSFGDTANQRVEDLIPRMFKTMESYEKQKKRVQIQAYKQAAEWKKRQEGWDNKWREEQRQKEKIEKLYKQVELWKKAEEIRAFASSFTRNAIKNRKKLKSAREVRKYVEFVKEYANSIDPLSDYFKDIP